MSKNIALICEFNPFHLGHKYIVEQARSLAGNDGCVICIMSGNFTQRGTPALFDKYARAKAAVLAGADIVAELPFPWSSGGAEDFARGGIAVAAGLCADGIVFGSESGNMEIITKAAEIKDSEGYVEALLKIEKESRKEGSAEIFDKAMEALGASDKLGANDKLACEYLRYGKRAGIGEYHCINRILNIKSATEIREAIFEEGLEMSACNIPSEAYKVFYEEAHNICREDRFFGILFDYCRLFAENAEANSVMRYAVNVARESENYGEFIGNLSTKKYTSARVRREILFSMLRVTNEIIGKSPVYTVLLGASAKGRIYLGQNKKDFSVEIITKPANIQEHETAVKQYRILNLADELYCLCVGRKSGYFMRCHPTMV